MLFGVIAFPLGSGAVASCLFPAIITAVCMP